jgi:hypothetical protein
MLPARASARRQCTASSRQHTASSNMKARKRGDDCMAAAAADACSAVLLADLCCCSDMTAGLGARQSHCCARTKPSACALHDTTCSRVLACLCALSAARTSAEGGSDIAFVALLPASDKRSGDFFEKKEVVHPFTTAA